MEILGQRAVPAAESDWDAEYGDYILAVRTVRDMDEAVAFINRHGTGHLRPSSPAITSRPSTSWTTWTQRRCMSTPPPALPTAGEFGLGAEIGISTQKMHARGPMGLEELTSCKYVIYGEGQVR